MHACLVVENFFGILTQCVCISFVTPIAVRVDLVNSIVKAPCYLHNFLMRNFTLTYDATGKGFRRRSNYLVGRMPNATMTLRLWRRFSFLRFFGVLRMLILIFIIDSLPKFILYKFFCNQLESRQHRNCRQVTPTCFRTCQDAVNLNFLFFLD